MTMSLNNYKLNKPQILQIQNINGLSCSLSSSEEDSSHYSDNSPLQQLFSYKYLPVKSVINIIDSKQSGVLIIDIRNNRYYQISHLKNAVNFNCSSSVMCRRSVVRWNKSKHCKNSCPGKVYDTYIVYDEDDITEQENALAFKFIDVLRRNCDNVCILKGGFSLFQVSAKSSQLDSSISYDTLSLYCASPTHKQSSSADVHRATLSEIIPDFLYVGNEMDAKDRDTLRAHSITDIINVTATVPHYFENKFNYHRLPASDSDKQNIAQFFDQAYDIIDSVKQRNGRVFIHCWAGVSRSVTIAMMYLIRNNKMDVLEALDYIKMRRSIADPNLNFLGQLSTLVKELSSNADTSSKCGGVI